VGYFDPVPTGILTPRSYNATALEPDHLTRLLSTLSKVSGGIDREHESNAQVGHNSILNMCICCGKNPVFQHVVLNMCILTPSSILVRL
jgi:hypothetical protein